jgi:hypothetical protein
LAEGMQAGDAGCRVARPGDKPLKCEADLQIMYRLTWFASPFDVNREVNNGRGLVHYKVSRGSADATLVEFSWRRIQN